MTDRLYLRDADLRSFVATVVAVDGDRVELDRTAFYATSGGQPHDTGHLVWAAGAASVIDVVTVDGTLWHTLAGPIPGAGTVVSGEVADRDGRNDEGQQEGVFSAQKGAHGNSRGMVRLVSEASPPF